MVFETPQTLSTNPADYSVKTLAGTVAFVTEAVVEQNNDVSVLLSLDYILQSRALYTVEVSGLSMVLFQYLAPTPEVVVQVSSFTGEVSGGLYGTPAGLVLFSPALESAAASSSIQIDDVSTCTKAYDSYEFPAPKDPAPLMTWPGAGFLGSGVAWGTRYQLAEFSWSLTIQNEESVSAPVDSDAVATITEVLDPAYVAYLGNPYWVLFNGIGNPFIVADNLMPIPSGTTIITPL